MTGRYLTYSILCSPHTSCLCVSISFIIVKQLFLQEKYAEQPPETWYIRRANHLGLPLTFCQEGASVFHTLLL